MSVNVFFSLNIKDVLIYFSFNIIVMQFIYNYYLLLVNLVSLNYIDMRVQSKRRIQGRLIHSMINFMCK